MARADSSESKEKALFRAVECYCGELLPGYYDDWILTERQRLADCFAGAARQMVSLLEQKGEWERALEFARRAAAADIYFEEAHGDVMRLLARLNRRKRSAAPLPRTGNPPACGNGRETLRGTAGTSRADHAGRFCRVPKKTAPAIPPSISARPRQSRKRRKSALPAAEESEIAEFGTRAKTPKTRQGGEVTGPKINAGRDQPARPI